MRDIKDKTIFYLTFAKTKLNLNCEKHKKAREDIDKIIKELRTNENRGVFRHKEL